VIGLYVGIATVGIFIICSQTGASAPHGRVSMCHHSQQGQGHSTLMRTLAITSRVAK
ncbi:hypothetical protein CFC21_057989, partial [Triticum aestivum]